MTYSQSIKDKIQKLSIEKNISFNSLLREYMYERFIERLSISKYKNNFILKGGYYLSIIFGIENRATMDIDTCLKKIKLSQENLSKIITDIINININDGTVFHIDNINLIRKENKYSGYRVSITAKIDKIRESFHLDVVTGDIITPKAITYKYRTMFENKELEILAYNLETILAEKLETILTRGEKSSRMKDYYDIYLIMQLKHNQINKQDLKNATKNTFNTRKFNNDIISSFKDIENSKILEAKWISYARKKQLKNINYKDIVKCIDKLINVITPKNTKIPI